MLHSGQSSLSCCQVFHRVVVQRVSGAREARTCSSSQISRSRKVGVQETKVLQGKLVVVAYECRHFLEFASKTADITEWQRLHAPIRRDLVLDQCERGFQSNATWWLVVCHLGGEGQETGSVAPASHHRARVRRTLV